MKILKFILLLSISYSAYANENVAANKRLGLGLSYTALFGNLRDYFKDGVSYNINGLWEIPKLWEGLYIGSSVDYAPLKGDDIRESTSLRLYSISLGLDKEFFKISWYSLFISLRPEITYWTVRNHLGRNYASSDKGNFRSLLVGLTNSFNISSLFEVEFFIFSHIPEIHLTNVYFDLGLRIAKNF